MAAPLTLSNPSTQVLTAIDLPVPLTSRDVELARSDDGGSRVDIRDLRHGGNSNDVTVVGENDHLSYFSPQRPLERASSVPAGCDQLQSTAAVAKANGSRDADGRDTAPRSVQVGSMFWKPMSVTTTNETGVDERCRGSTTVAAAAAAVARSSSSCSGTSVRRKFHDHRRSAATQAAAAAGTGMLTNIDDPRRGGSADRLTISVGSRLAAAESDSRMADGMGPTDPLLPDYTSAVGDGPRWIDSSSGADGCASSTLPTCGAARLLQRTRPSSTQPNASVSFRHHQLFGSSSVIYRRKRVLEVPFDENNVPQIDRAVTPPPPEHSTDTPAPTAGCFATEEKNKSEGDVKAFGKLRTTGTKSFGAPPFYHRRFASLRLPTKPTTSGIPGASGIVNRTSSGGLHRTATVGQQRGRRTTGDFKSESHSLYGSQLSVNSCRLQDCRYGKMQMLQNIGDDVSLYGTPREELSPTVPVKSVNFANDLRDQLIAMFQVSDNKLAMKLFGNKNALMKEKMRQKAVGKWVIHPCSNFRFYWDVIMLVLLIANLIILPVAISFFNDDLSVQWIVFNGVSDTVFMLDLVINFRTGIIADNFADEIILEPHEIARRYLRSWFLLDLVSSMPLDYFILLFSPDANLSQLIHAGRALKVFRLVKLLSLLRLLRLSRLVRYVSQWEEFLTVASKFMRIFNLVCLILLLGHWNGCLQWLVPMLQDFPSNSWPALEELQHADWLEQYTWALFKALSHMLCIGFGRYPPQSTTDVWLTMVSMLTGATCYALFVGHSTTLIQSFDTSKRLYREKFKQVEEYMAYRKLHRNLRQKITEYYEHRFRGKMFDEKRILEEVNECLKEEIVNYNCRELVAAVPFFTHADPNFVTDVVTKLEYEVFQPGDYVIKEGTMGTKMYFIQEGIVDIVTKNGEVATSLSDGSYFGEICLLTNSRRVASVRAESYCSLFSLSVDQFHSVLEHYPVMRRTLESVAAQRLNKIGKNPSMVSTRDDFEDDINTVNELIMHGANTDQSSCEGEDTCNELLTNVSGKAGKKRKAGFSKDSSAKLSLKFALALKKKRHSRDESSSGHDVD